MINPIMVLELKLKIVSAIVFVALTMLALPCMTLAHEGEDHGDAQEPIVSADTGMIARTARAGDWEIVVKHPLLEPDHEIAARVFVTRFDSNEPITNAKVVVMITGEGGAPVEAQASAGSMPGVYEVKLSPLSRGQYGFAVQASANDVAETAQYGTIQVLPAPPSKAESSTGWARAGLFALAMLVILSVLGALGYRAVQGNRARSSKEAATA